MVDAAHVVARLEELRGWSNYILDSLLADQPYERGKLTILEGLAGGRELQEARELASALAAKLRNLSVRVEFTPEARSEHASQGGQAGPQVLQVAVDHRGD